MSDPCEGPDGEENPTWPPANFECWPGTRYGALIFVGVSVLLWCIPPMWTKYRAFVHWNVLIGPLIFGFWISFTAHFVPCIWWTCDWGYYDGQSVRGMIWFVGWALVDVFLMIWVCKKKRQRQKSQNELSGNNNEQIRNSQSHID